MLKMFCTHAQISLEFILCMNFNITQLFMYNLFMFHFIFSFIVFRCKPLLFPMCFSHLFSGTCPVLVWPRSFLKCRTQFHPAWLVQFEKVTSQLKKGRDGDGLNQILNLRLLQTGCYSTFHSVSGSSSGRREVTQPPAIPSSPSAGYVAAMIYSGVRASWPCGCGFRWLSNN